ARRRSPEPALFPYTTLFRSENVPGVRRRAEAGELAFGTVDTWLLWNLSDGALHVTDVSNASRTLLYNIYTGDWDDDILAKLNIPDRKSTRLNSSHVKISYAV